MKLSALSAALPSDQLIKAINEDAKIERDEHGREQRERYALYVLLYVHAVLRALKAFRIREAFDLHHRAQLWRQEQMMFSTESILPP